MENPRNTREKSPALVEAQIRQQARLAILLAEKAERDELHAGGRKKGRVRFPSAEAVVFRTPESK